RSRLTSFAVQFTRKCTVEHEPGDRKRSGRKQYLTHGNALVTNTPGGTISAERFRQASRSVSFRFRRFTSVRGPLAAAQSVALWRYLCRRSVLRSSGSLAARRRLACRRLCKHRDQTTASS